MSSESSDEIYIPHHTLRYVLTKKFGCDIADADYKTERLHGGTLGDVRLVTGTAISFDGIKQPYSVVYKTQKKWERYGDPDSWRREYDLYSSDLEILFTATFRRAECYHTELDDGEVRLWLEYVGGSSGLALTPDMYAAASAELGKFQGRLYTDKNNNLQSQTNLSKTSYLKDNYLHYRSWSEVYDYIRSDSCGIPEHLRKMIIAADQNSDEIFACIEKLPIVFCHRDFWVTNIFYSDGKFTLIDWDTAGWGYFGEDIASLIADEADVENMVSNFRRCVAAYYEGFSEFATALRPEHNCVFELILIKFGYRIVEWHKFAESTEQKCAAIQTLQKIYEIGQSR
jgi:Putative homoserine kinase type II (protein kinase fold)